MPAAPSLALTDGISTAAVRTTRFLVTTLVNSKPAVFVEAHETCHAAHANLPTADWKETRNCEQSFYCPRVAIHCSLQFANVDQSFLANCSQEVVGLPRKTNDFAIEWLALELRRDSDARLNFLGATKWLTSYLS
jgi:hypothetical protein